MIYDIENRRAELNMTLDDVAEIVGVTKATVNKWEKGDIANMKRDKIVKLATALKISPLLLVGIEPEENTKIQDEISLPFLGTVAAGGFEVSATTNEQLTIPSSLIKESSDNYFILKVNGDSMNKIIANGHYVVVLDYSKTTNNTYTTNDILIIGNGGEYTMKRVRKTETMIHLEPDSYIDEFTTQSILIDELSEIKIVGKVVYSFRNL